MIVGEVMGKRIVEVWRDRLFDIVIPRWAHHSGRFVLGVGRYSIPICTLRAGIK